MSRLRSDTSGEIAPRATEATTNSRTSMVRFSPERVKQVLGENREASANSYDAVIPLSHVTRLQDDLTAMSIKHV